MKIYRKMIAYMMVCTIVLVSVPVVYGDCFDMFYSKGQNCNKLTNPFHCWPTELDNAGCYPSIYCLAGKRSYFDDLSKKVACRSCNATTEYNPESLPSNDKEKVFCTQKEKCNDIGKVVVELGGSQDNSVCGCDFKNGYVNKYNTLKCYSNGIYYCNCYKKKCPSGTYWHLSAKTTSIRNKRFDLVQCLPCEGNMWTNGTVPCQAKTMTCDQGYNLIESGTTEQDNFCNKTLAKVIIPQVAGPSVQKLPPGRSHVGMIVGTVGGVVCFIGIVAIVYRCRQKIYKAYKALKNKSVSDSDTEKTESEEYGDTGSENSKDLEDAKEQTSVMVPDKTDNVDSKVKSQEKILDQVDIPMESKRENVRHYQSPNMPTGGETTVSGLLDAVIHPPPLQHYQPPPNVHQNNSMRTGIRNTDPKSQCFHNDVEEDGGERLSSLEAIASLGNGNTIFIVQHGGNLQYGHNNTLNNNNPVNAREYDDNGWYREGIDDATHS